MLRHSALIVLEVAAGVLGMAAVGGGILAWRLQQGPLEVGWLTPYLEQAINQQAPMRVDVGSTVLSWGGFGAPINVRAVDLTAFGESGQPVANIPELSIAFSLPALLQARVAPTRIEVVEPTIAAIRTEEGKFRLDIRDGDEDSSDPQAGSRILDDLLTALRSPPDPTEPLGALTELRITRASLWVENRQTGALWTAPDVSLILLRDGQGIRGTAEADIDLGGRVNRLAAQVSYRAVDGGLSLRTALADVRPSDFGEVAPVLGPLGALDVAFAGTVTLDLDAGFAPQSLSIDLAGGAGTLSLPEHLPEPVALEGVRLQGRLDEAGQHLRLEQFALDLGRPLLTVTGDVRQQGRELNVAVAADLADLPMEELPRYWPAGVAEGVRSWMVGNMERGSFDRTSFALEGTAPVDRPQELSVTKMDGRISLSGFTLHYRKPLPPLRNVAGTATFDGKVLDIAVSQGSLYGLRASDGRVRILGLDTSSHSIDIQVPLQGPLADALTVLNHEPLGYPARIGLKPETVDGQALADLRFAFPLIKDLRMEDVRIAATAHLTDVSIPDLVADIDASEGTLDLSVTGDELAMSGTALLNGVPSRVVWSEVFSDTADIGTKVRVLAELDDEERSRFRLDFPDWLNGPAKVDLTYLRPRGKPQRIEAEVDIAPSTLRIDLMDWEKPPGIPGRADLVVEFVDGKPTLLPEFRVVTRELTTMGRMRLWPEDFRIARLELDSFRLGAETNARLEMTSTRDGTKTLAVTGSDFDARPFLGRGKDREEAPPETEEDGPELPLDIAFDIARVTTGDEGQTIRSAVGTASRIDGHWRNATLNATVGEGAPLKLRYWPEGQSLLLTLESDDAGATLRDLGLLNYVRGGKLLVTGRSDPADPARTVAGKIDMRDYQVQDAPVLARLLSAASPQGFAEFLSGSPLSFSRLAGEFFWHDRGITFRDVRTSGNAVGLTLEGEVNVDEGRADLQGTVVPFSTVNKLLGAIPLVGDLLVGGEGQGLFAATYNVRGPLGDLQIGVNPLAMLTPGFLRNLFFMGQPAGEAGRVPKDQPVPGQDNTTMPILPTDPGRSTGPAAVEPAPLEPIPVTPTPVEPSPGAGQASGAAPG
ncbi:DUF3971 domain-containing protein [Indioceanicola profundi]|uniref:DUF3971 domain-containing protein n=1 Tax=Indioceanicola profundi TaxID=2220096 RepID=UPI0013C48BC7|nr:DUF3971 domain-containing protein [Indioceanicola profundi]